MNIDDYDSTNDYARHVIESGGPQPEDDLSWARYGVGEYVERIRATYPGVYEDPDSSVSDAF